MDVGRALGDPGLNHVLVGQRPVGRDGAPGGSRAHEVEGAVADADPAHAVVDAARTEPLLRDNEPVAFRAEQIALRHAAGVVEDLGVARPVVSGVAHNVDVAYKVETGSIGGDDNHRGAVVGRRFRIGDCHDHGKCGAIGRRRVPLLAVDDVVVAVLDRGGLHHHRVRARHLDLGHRKAAADLPLDQRP